ncbi:MULTISPECIES: hypothetical protein [unclassified Paenibacillus]|uniref:hypothetical protein n=1 Tax=unclassified Paenibacillus TaxID=185978 RepID=UPI00020D6FFD|nr:MULTISPECIES: hypothetical protein [unclassified Paenibacillus]EGL20015.1 hypothetical protein HMPREF9413_1071 [Paenibacillus sp. HGF7]EPD82034.1 hypothetical protein HMPREF1207_03860 [Paenibacillus sp. HGH0039]
MAVNLSTFPVKIDEFQRHYELQAQDIPGVQRFQELKLKANRTPAEETELANLTVQYREKFISADDFNRFQDALVNMEIFIKDNVEGYILTKQGEFTTYVDIATNTVQATKDSALQTIEQKKENVITYLDGTTAGALRNDIGVMGDLETVNKQSLVKVANELRSDNIKIDNKIGALSTLNTTDQSNIVKAMNEIKSNLEIAYWMGV